MYMYVVSLVSRLPMQIVGETVTYGWPQGTSPYLVVTINSTRPPCLNLLFILVTCSLAGSMRSWSYTVLALPVLLYRRIGIINSYGICSFCTRIKGYQYH